MASLSSLFDPELLRRYDTPGPRYTSYPTAPQFSSSFGEADLREMAAISATHVSTYAAPRALL